MVESTSTNEAEHPHSVAASSVPWPLCFFHLRAQPEQTPPLPRNKAQPTEFESFSLWRNTARPTPPVQASSLHHPSSLTRGRSNTKAALQPERRFRNTTLEFFLSAPMAAEIPASLGAAADTLAVDHGLARASTHSNGWRVQCARAGHFHSTARAAAAGPGYR